MFDATVVKLLARVVNSAPDVLATDDNITVGVVPRDIPVVVFENKVAFVGITVASTPPPHFPLVAAVTAQAGNSLSPK